MKRAAAVTIIFILLCSVLGGCSFWTTGDYLSVTPHEAQVEITGDTIVEVTSYAQLRNALRDLVEGCCESGIISITSFSNATVDFYVDTAIRYVIQDTAIGGYAVDEINYEIGTNRGATVVAVDIEYRHSRAEVLGMQQVRNSDEMMQAIASALEENEPYLVICTDNYEALDFVQFVQEYANSNPDLVMEQPQVGACLYPDRGSKRIVELTFTYLTDRDALQQMQERVEEVFTSAELYVKETTQVKDIYSRLYSFLMERNDYNLKTSITPAYSLLQHGVGDSRAFANVYAAMCRHAELDCKVISGTRDAEPWCWNLVRFRGNYYHVDLLRCNENGAFKMLRGSEMTGYVWDYSAYPTS